MACWGSGRHGTGAGGPGRERAAEPSRSAPPRRSAVQRSPTSTRGPAICTGRPTTARRWERRWSPELGTPLSRRPPVGDVDVSVRLSVNGQERSDTVEPRLTLADFLRERCHLTGTHLGCEHGVCGACTVLVDGAAVRSCLMFAVQADGSEVTTVEGIASPEGELSPVQSALRGCHGLQCGFCTPGFVMTITALLRDNPHTDRKSTRLNTSH